MLHTASRLTAKWQQQRAVWSMLTERLFSSTSLRLNFWEADRKGGYSKIIDRPAKEQIKDGLKMLPEELTKFKQEFATRMRCDSIFTLEHGDYEIVWKFNSDESTKSWMITTDKDNDEGHSAAEFVLGPNKHGIFRGKLDTTVPKDGIIKNAGYCNIRSPTNMISFKRIRPYAWDLYTHLVMRVRGDGRSYQVVLNMERKYDLQWNDQYSYALFTRGGPYWQMAKIPFSKFYLSSKGRIQDKQEAVQLDRIRTLGITTADSVPGPFHLEIDFIAVVHDSTHTDKFEYEMYPVSPSVFS